MKYIASIVLLALALTAGAQTIQPPATDSQVTNMAANGVYVAPSGLMAFYLYNVLPAIAASTPQLPSVLTNLATGLTNPPPVGGSVAVYDAASGLWKATQNMTYSNMTLTLWSNGVAVASLSTNGQINGSVDLTKGRGQLSAGQLPSGVVTNSATPTFQNFTNYGTANFLNTNSNPVTYFACGGTRISGNYDGVNSKLIADKFVGGNSDASLDNRGNALTFGNRGTIYTYAGQWNYTGTTNTIILTNNMLLFHGYGPSGGGLACDRTNGYTLAELPTNYFALWNSNAIGAFFLDVNVAGTIKRLSLGTAQ